MMADIRIPTFAELLKSIPDAHLILGAQLAAAIGSAEAQEVFRQLRAPVTDKAETSTSK